MAKPIKNLGAQSKKNNKTNSSSLPTAQARALPFHALTTPIFPISCLGSTNMIPLGIPMESKGDQSQPPSEPTPQQLQASSKTPNQSLFSSSTRAYPATQPGSTNQ
jgi:hypothetical protein